MICGWLVMIGRLIHLQATERQQLNKRVIRQSEFTEPIPARPGDILDRNGNVLAMTVTRNSLYIVPDEIEDITDYVWKLTEAIDINTADVYRRLARSPEKRFIWVKRRLTDAEAERIQNLDLPGRTWGFRREYLRQYPQGAFAAHVLGMRNIDNQGRGGLEQSLDEHLRGHDGQRFMTRDARGLVVEVAQDKSEPPTHGQTVVTTLDVLIQIQTEELLQDLIDRWQPKGACAVVMEPASGDVLAMASAPTFNPNRPGEVKGDAWKNLAVSAVFEPGSTFKPFIVGWAVQNQQLRKDDQIQCFSGAYRMGQRVLHDHHPYASLSVEDVLVKSSNIGMARIAERMGLDQLYQATASFGFGRRTGIELPGEINGLVRPASDWDDYSLGSIPMGHELAVTPLQLITAHCCLANGGTLVRPRLLMPSKDASFTPTPVARMETVDSAPALQSRLLSPSVAHWLVNGPMQGVIERGTGQYGRIPGLKVFGKTGTAQKADAETGGYSDSRHVCSFVCGAPAHNPRVVVLVMVDEPTAPGQHYGGTVAAPTGARLLDFAIKRLPRMTHQTAVGPSHDLAPRGG